jgi:hypothetical protein
LPTAATSAVAFSGPMPGIVVSSRAVSSGAGLERELLVESLDARSSPRHSAR